MDARTGYRGRPGDGTVRWMEQCGDDPGVVAAGAIRTLSGAAVTFFGFGSPRVIAAGLSAAVVARALVARSVGWSRWDVVAIAMVAGLIPFVEWFVHLVVLHAEPRRFAGVIVDTGAGHREHHLRPASLDRVLLRAPDALLFQLVNAAVVWAVVGIPLAIIGVAVTGPVSTGVVVAIGGLAHYEWAHFLFHTAYRPRTRYYRRLKSNHRLHHWRNERYWLGVTSNAGDRVLGTYRARSQVPLSPTARNLRVSPPAGGPGSPRR